MQGKKKKFIKLRQKNRVFSEIKKVEFRLIVIICIFIATFILTSTLIKKPSDWVVLEVYTTWIN